MNTAKERYRKRPILVRGKRRDLGSPFPPRTLGRVYEACSEPIPFPDGTKSHRVLPFPVRTSTNLNYFD